MKNLFDKPLRFFIGYSLFILILSIPFYYYMVDAIWSAELDENNEIIAKRAQYQLEHTDYKIHNADSLIRFWNIIQPNARIQSLNLSEFPKKDTTYSVYKASAYSDYKDLDRFRVLETEVKINGHPYVLIVESNIEEVYEIVLGITFLTIIFFILLVFGFVYYNQKMTQKLWNPFKQTLDNLKKFKLEDGLPIENIHSNIVEFEELNTAISKLTNKNLEVYKIQKEFTENASHELQTPLAILQAKLELILQVNTLDKQQYKLIEDAKSALVRAIRINKNLLFLARIENRQFPEKEEINIAYEVNQTMELLDYELKRKNLSLSLNLDATAAVTTNRFLFTSLIQNLITNSLRHTENGGEIAISCSKESISFQNSGNRELNSEMVFKKFARLNDDSPGIGIGLSITKEICNHNKWAITYQFKESMHTFNITF